MFNDELGRSVVTGFTKEERGVQGVKDLQR